MIPFEPTAVLAIAIVMLSLGIFAGHAAGYARAKDVERRRQAAALTGGPKYRRETRVGSPE